ncbi:hypothetical protein [Pedobacter jamesrossensis]|uniref:Phosphoribosylpyrophosphate synthetase n=1 Tax=Pedobacter jamesrossensis TaxID=1908238 RepID=A0ABV8NR42_9SPHI
MEKWKHFLSQLNGINNPIQEFREQFLIDSYYRYEGESDPEDEAIVYAISSVDGTIKGLFVSDYGPSSESKDDELIKNIKARIV